MRLNRKTIPKPKRSHPQNQRQARKQKNKREKRKRTSPRPISTGQLNVLPHVHLQPINLVVYKEPYSL